MAMNPNGIIKGFNILKNEPVGMFVVNDIKSVKPFSFNQGMERFDTGVIVRITAVRIASPHGVDFDVFIHTPTPLKGR